MTSDTLRGQTPVPSGCDEKAYTGRADDYLSEYSRKDSVASSLSDDWLGDSVRSGGEDASVRTLPSTDRAARREARKKRVSNRLDRYRRDIRRLEGSRAALERRLARAKERLRWMESHAAPETASHESEAGGDEEAAGRSEAIMTLGRKLSRQARKIEQKKDAAEHFKTRLEEMRDEMAARDQRASRRRTECARLRERCDGAKEQKVRTQNTLQKNIEEMAGLYSEKENNARGIRKLELDLQQEEAALGRAAEEVSDNSRKISRLEEELDERKFQAHVLREKLNESQAAAENIKKELESANAKAGELRRRQSSCRVSTVDSAGMIRGVNRATDSETLEKELRATVRGQEETVRALRSAMARETSAYRRESYPRRREIAQLKQRNAECALSLRTLERALVGVNAARGAAMAGPGPRGRTTRGERGASPTSRRNKSSHAVGSLGGRYDEVTAAEAGLEEPALHPFLSPVSGPVTDKGPNENGGIQLFRQGGRGRAEVG